jgi:hypothetical protein
MLKEKKMEGTSAGIIHRVYGYISEKTFYAMLNEAKMENVFTSEDGRVDIGALVAELVTTFAEGRYCILNNKPPRKDKITIENESIANKLLETVSIKSSVTKRKSKAIKPIETPPEEIATDTTGSVITNPPYSKAVQFVEGIAQ